MWKTMEKMLLKMKEDILVNIKKEMKEGVSKEKEDGLDIYDQASSERDRELALLLNDRERKRLQAIDDALDRIKKGEYGICDSCGDEIAKGRLKAMPFTTMCVNCKAEEEKRESLQRETEEDMQYRNLNYMEDDEY